MRTWVVAVVAALGSVRASAEPPPPSVPALEAQVQLVSGKVLKGRVVGTETIQGNSLLQVETDWGQILVPAKEVKQKVEPRPAPDATFFAGEVRVVRIQGTVERQTAAGGDWFPVQWTDAYGREIVNAPNAMVKPGDRVRTGSDGGIDLQLHADVWVRVTAGSEILLPAAPSTTGTLTLLRGAAIHDVAGRPRGQTFRVATPTQVLGVRGTRFAVRLGDTERVLVADGTVQVGGLGAVERGTGATWAEGRLQRSPLTREERETVTVQIIRLPAMDMAWIPGGPYVLGDGRKANLPSGEGDGRATSVDSNLDVEATVELRAFLMDRREVTATELVACSRARGLPDITAGRVGGSEPAITSWHDAARYASWTGARLPSEAEWEAAARGKERRRFPWGDRVDPVHETLPGWWPADGSGKETKAPSVLLPTPDVSPEGVRNLVSGAGEWTRDWSDLEHPVVRYSDGRLWSELHPPFTTFGDPGQRHLGFKVVRGYRGARFRHSEGLGGNRGLVRPWGFRCVRELD